MRLHTDAWRAEPVVLDSVSSSYFEDPQRFPAGTAHLDSALVQRNVPVRWDPLPSLPFTPSEGAPEAAEDRRVAG